MLLLAAAAFACPPAAVASGQDPVDAVQAEIVAFVNNADAGGLFGRFSGPMREAVPEPAAVKLIVGIRAAGGCIATSERTSGSARRGVYLLVGERRSWQLDVHVDDAGVIQGLRFGDPPAPTPPVARSAPFAVFPVTGRWTVIWGGDTQELNAHITHASQRRAADLVMVGADGRTYTGDGTRPSDYHAWDQPVRAVADGVVVTAIDGVYESVPARLNPYFTMGNAVFIAHEGGAWSVYAHLRPGSVRVKAGQRVRAGKVIGRVGNSGNTTEPHLHFQLQDGPAFEASWGIEAVFSGVEGERDGQPLPAGEYTFRKGDVVETK